MSYYDSDDGPSPRLQHALVTALDSARRAKRRCRVLKADAARLRKALKEIAAAEHSCEEEQCCMGEQRSVARAALEGKP